MPKSHPHAAPRRFNATLRHALEKLGDDAPDVLEKPRKAKQRVGRDYVVVPARAARVKAKKAPRA